MNGRRDQAGDRKATPPTNSTATPPRFSAADYANDNNHHILLAASGSVATIKIPLIAEHLSNYHDHSKSGVSIRIVLTSSAEEFLQGQSAEQPHLNDILCIPGVDGIYRDADEWSKPWVRGDKILHIELRRWAHVMVIAPLSANTMAKMVNGISDGLVLSVVRAWDTTGLIDGRRKRIFVAPAMNTAMWRHPVTRKQIDVLEKEWGVSEDRQDIDSGWVTVLRPMEKTLACGDTGDGAMMDWKLIVAEVEKYLGLEPQKVKTPDVNGSAAKQS